MKFLITESQFENLIETQVPPYVKRRISRFEDYLNSSMNRLSLNRWQFRHFVHFLETTLDDTVDRLYHGWFSEIDSTSEEWLESAKFIRQYLLNTFYNKINLFYQANIK